VQGFFDTYFDSSSIDSLELFCSFSEKVLWSPLRYASFPALDVDRILRLPQFGQGTDAMVLARDQLHVRFLRTYRQPYDMIDRAKHFAAAPVSQVQTDAAQAKVAVRRVSTRFGIDGIIVPKGFGDAAQMGPRITKAYRECLGQAEEVGPIMELMFSIQENFNFEALVRDAG
jgi:hypothetical protein